MRICFIIETFYPVSAGVGNSTRSLASALAALGHEVRPSFCPKARRMRFLRGFP
jgi:hypothetical protein